MNKESKDICRDSALVSYINANIGI